VHRVLLGAAVATVSPLLAVPLFVSSLLVTLAAARLFARRLDRLGLRFGLPEAVIGLLAALAADGPEISSALVALIKGAHSVSVGVLVGSSVFNFAAMIGVSALLAGSVLLRREVLLLEGFVVAMATLIVAALLLGWLPALAAVVLLACVLVPYLLLLIHGAPSVGSLSAPGRLVGRIARVVDLRQPAVRPSGSSQDPAHHLLGLVVMDVVLIVAGSTGMVQAALALGDRWGVSDAVLGVLILAPLTSLPNALTGVRLGLARRGPALVSETFNSNTMNLAVGVTLPALFVGVSEASALGRVDIAWLVAMTAVCLLLLAQPAGLRRAGGAVLISLYIAFVAIQLIAA
jgi:cation:H+ antiporter